MFHLFMGREHDKIDERFRSFKRRLEAHTDSKKEAVEITGIIGLMLWERDGDEAIDIAIRLREQPPIRLLIERMLTEHCEPEWITEAVYHKFKERVDEEVIEAFQTYWWDTDLLNAWDMANHYHRSGKKRPEPPPVPGPMREQYMAYQQGVDVDLDADAALRDIFKSAFFKSKELETFGIPAYDKVAKFQKNAMKAYKTIQDANADTGSALPEKYQHEIVYPDDTAKAADELENYDPVEDSGYTPEEESDHEAK